MQKLIIASQYDVRLVTTWKTNFVNNESAARLLVSGWDETEYQCVSCVVGEFVDPSGT
jgi:hypothetical protein